MKHPNRIRELRLSMGLTQKQLALMFPVPKDVTVISRWERGLNRPDADALVELTRIFGVPAEEIMSHNKPDKSGLDQSA